MLKLGVFYCDKADQVKQIALNKSPNTVLQDRSCSIRHDAMSKRQVQSRKLRQ